MYRFSINIDSKKSRYLDYIKKSLFYSVVNAGGSQRLTESDGRHFLEISVEEEYKQRLALGIKSAVAEVIALGFKTDYLREKLRFPSDTLLNRTIVNTMSVFDNAEDKRITYGAIEDLKNLSLDGLFLFRLGRLRKRWDEIVEITGMNGAAFYDDFVKTDFLRYLVKALPSLCDKITVNVDMHGIALYDATGFPIDNIALLKSEEFSAEEELLFNLISFAPERVEITGDRELASKELLSLVEAVFLLFGDGSGLS